MNETQSSDSLAKLSEQELQWEASRRANELEWVNTARYGSLVHSLVWMGLHGYLHRGVTPQAIMQKEALELNRQYDSEHSE